MVRISDSGVRMEGLRTFACLELMLSTLPITMLVGLVEGFGLSVERSVFGV